MFACMQCLVSKRKSKRIIVALFVALYDNSSSTASQSFTQLRGAVFIFFTGAFIYLCADLL